MSGSVTNGGRGGDGSATLAPARAGTDADTVLLRAAADQLLQCSFAGWFYGDSIGFEGLLAATALLADPRYRAWAHGFLRGWATRAEPRREMDNTAPGRVLCILAEEEPDGILLEAGEGLCRFLMERPVVAGGVYVSFARAPLRKPYGGSTLLADEAALLADPGPGAYVDCLHFDPPFLVHLGRLLGDRSLVDAGIAQATGYVRALADEATGLFHHFWLERTQRPYVLGWSRGQGWALLGLLDVLEQAPADHPGRPPLIHAVRALADAMIARQLPSGHWDAVAGDPASGHESSTAAFMASGLARGVDLGLLEPGALRAAHRAWLATMASVGPDGVLCDVSAAVWSSTQVDHYRHVPTGFTVPWGQGPLLVAATRWLLADAPGTDPGGAQPVRLSPTP